GQRGVEGGSAGGGGGGGGGRGGGGKLVRASTHASGTPMTRETPVVTDAVHRERTRAWVASDPLRAAPICPQGARINSPASGSSKNATAISAGTSSGAGTDRGAPVRPDRLARSRAVRRDGAVRVTMAAPVSGHGCSNPAVVSTLRPAGDNT